MVIVAAGQGARAGGGVPKQFRMLGGRTVLAHSVAAFAAHRAVGPIHIVVAEGEEDRAAAALGRLAPRVTVGRGGGTRQQSVLAGLRQFANDSPPKRVLVHDAARPLVPQAMIGRVLAALDGAPGACPALPVADSLRRGGAWIEEMVARDGLWRVQTPQGFDFSLLLEAHVMASDVATDDAEGFRAAGHPVRLVAGDERALKITGPADFAFAEALIGGETVTGSGYDVHRFGPGDHLFLCGVRIPHHRGLVGHSDADVALHALTDAILGGLGAGDIGVHFPPGDPRWKGAASDRFLGAAADLVTEAGGRIVHCDLTVIAEEPRVGPWRPAMVERLGAILSAHAPRLSVKATTTEQLGFTGRREGIAAQALATLRLPRWRME